MKITNVTWHLSVCWKEVDVDSSSFSSPDFLKSHKTSRENNIFVNFLKEKMINLR